MKDTNKRPGRPVKYADRPLKRIQLLVFEDQHEAAEAEARRRGGVSLSEVYRDWVDGSIKRKGK